LNQHKQAEMFLKLLMHDHGMITCFWKL